MTNKVERINENGTLLETYDYDGRFSAVYTLQLVWCWKHKVNMYDKQQREKAKESFNFGEATVSFVFDNDVFLCRKQEGRKDLYDGINGSALDFYKA